MVEAYNNQKGMQREIREMIRREFGGSERLAKDLQ